LPGHNRQRRQRFRTLARTCKSSDGGDQAPASGLLMEFLDVLLVECDEQVVVDHLWLTSMLLVSAPWSGERPRRAALPPIATEPVGAREGMLTSSTSSGRLGEAGTHPPQARCPPPRPNGRVCNPDATDGRATCVPPGGGQAGRTQGRSQAGRES